MLFAKRITRMFWTVLLAEVVIDAVDLPLVEHLAIASLMARALSRSRPIGFSTMMRAKRCPAGDDSRSTKRRRASCLTASARTALAGTAR
jgi:hypothetical protein